MQIMSGILRQVPAYVLELGTDVRQIPEVIFNLLSQLESGGSLDAQRR
jgi:hypothetical protein